MNFEYSKSREQKKKMKQQLLEKKRDFVKKQKNNRYLIDETHKVLVSTSKLDNINISNQEDDQSMNVNATNVTVTLLSPNISLILSLKQAFNETLDLELFLANEKKLHYLFGEDQNRFVISAMNQIDLSKNISFEDVVLVNQNEQKLHYLFGEDQFQLVFNVGLNQINLSKRDNPEEIFLANQHEQKLHYLFGQDQNLFVVPLNPIDLSKRANPEEIFLANQNEQKLHYLIGADQNQLVVSKLAMNPFHISENVNKEEYYKGKYSKMLNANHLDLFLFYTPLDEEPEKETPLKEEEFILEEVDEVGTLEEGETVKRPKIAIIHNYQTRYQNGNASGFGDFLRGSYYLLQFCEEYKYECKIDLSNHLISSFLKNLEKTESTRVYDRRNIPIYKFVDINADLSVGEKNLIQMNVKSNYDSLKDFLKKQRIVDRTISLNTNSFPLSTPSAKDKERIKTMMEPTEEIVDLIKRTFVKLRLWKDSFTVIHIRFGDSYLIENNQRFNLKMLDRLKKEIKEFILTHSPNNNYLLLADNNSIKQYLVETFPFLKTSFKPITHLGEGVSLDYEKTKNTLVDYHLMSYAKEIVSYSCYLHGSGFSKWCAETYDIPYTNKFIG